DIETLGDELAAVRTERDEWRARIPPLEDSLLARENEIDLLQRKTRSSEEEKHGLERELADWRAKMTGMESSLREKDAQLDREATARKDLELDLEELKLAEEKLATWDSTITTLRGELREREQTINSLLEEFSALAEDKVSIPGWPAAVNAVKSKMDGLRSEFDEAQETLSRNEHFAEDREAMEHQLNEYQIDIKAMRTELEKTQGAVRSADLAEIALEKNREQITRLKKDLSEKTERIDELEMFAADWVDKHAALNSKHESLSEKFEAQRETIVRMRADKLSKDDSEEFPTLTAVVQRGKRPSS
ncbi:MAG: hypothetical protein OES99_12215, partial [Gammaproteobacteria bacterium]|nr:hypothetical protein [Gammaproteobacteria bacterium]